MIVVHVILPGGPTYEHPFPDSYRDARILADLEKSKRLFGYARTVPKPDPALAAIGHPSPTSPVPDRTGPMCWDDPATRVVVGRWDSDDIDTRRFQEIRTLKGPKEAPCPAST